MASLVDWVVKYLNCLSLFRFLFFMLFSTFSFSFSFPFLFSLPLPLFFFHFFRFELLFWIYSRSHTMIIYLLYHTLLFFSKTKKKWKLKKKVNMGSAVTFWPPLVESRRTLPGASSQTGGRSWHAARPPPSSIICPSIPALTRAAAALLATLRYPSCGSLLVTGEAARLTSWSSVLVIRPWLLIGTDLLLGLCSARLWYWNGRGGANHAVLLGWRDRGNEWPRSWSADGGDWRGGTESERWRRISEQRWWADPSGGSGIPDLGRVL